MKRATALALLLPALALAQPKPIDHGMVLATAMDVAPGFLKDTIKLSDTRNYVFRGRVITFNPERTLHLCFDAEHLRVAGVWKGEYVHYAAQKNMGPEVKGTMLAVSRPGPGWSKNGVWGDPRQSGEGPLPPDWAHYRGVYLAGDDTVVSYTVQGTGVLDHHGADAAGVVRTVNLEPNRKPLAMQICAVPDNTKPPTSQNVWTLPTDPPTHLALVHDCAGVSLGLEEGRAVVHFGESDKPTRVKVLISQGPSVDAFLKDRSIRDLSMLTHGGPPRWSHTVVTPGKLGADTKSPYTVDSIPAPEKNPWNASIRFAGVDFFADGKAVVSTWDGDVWLVSGLDQGLEKVTWKRILAGLQQPLGLKVVGDVIYTAGRDQISRLHDLNGDGEIDFVENFNNNAGLTLQRHEFVMDLHTDTQGNFYFCRSGHYYLSKKKDNCCIYKMSPDGKNLQKIAWGFREPNGMGVGPDGTVTAGDNEGNGIPQTPIYRIKEGVDYGFDLLLMESKKTSNAAWKLKEPPMVWLPKHVDRSAGGQAWVPGERWGSLSGQLIHTSYGNAALFTVLIDKAAEPWQAAVWKFPVAFTSGIMRARFAPHDGQLYVCGLRGWDTNGVVDGQLARVRYTGEQVPIPTGFRVTKVGLELKFSLPLDAKSAGDDQNWAGDWQAMLTSSAKELKKRDEMVIDAIDVSADRKEVHLKLEEIKSVANFSLQYRVKSAEGKLAAGELHGTINRVP